MDRRRPRAVRAQPPPGHRARTPATALDAALGDLGWHDALADDPQAAVSLLFELQGEANATSSALDQSCSRTGWASSGRRPSCCCRRSARWRRPDGSTASGRRCDGLGTAASADADAVLVVAPRRRQGRRRRSCRPPSSTRRPVDGVDPWLGLVEVTGEADDRRARPVTDWAGRGRARPARARPRARRRVADDAGAGPRARARARPVRPADQQLPGGPPPAGRHARRHRDRRARCSTPRGSTSRPATAAMAKALAGRGARTAAAALPAGARRHRLHHRAPAAPLRPARARARPAPRLGPHPHPRARRRPPRHQAAPRRCSPSDPPNPFLRRIGCGSQPFRAESLRRVVLGEEAVDVGAELGRGERAVLGGEREVERGQRRPARGGC